VWAIWNFSMSKLKVVESAEESQDTATRNFNISEN
jgi:hypothetical protein